VTPGVVRLRDALPDVPRWLEVRALLALPSSELYVSSEGFVVSARAAKLAAAVGNPEPRLFEAALQHADLGWSLLAAPEDAAAVAAALPGFSRARAVLHVLSGPTPRLAEPDPQVIALTASDLERLPESLAQELSRVVGEQELFGLEAAGVIAAVAYVPWQTERLYELSIVTLAPHRQKGYGQRVARALLDRRDEVRRPVLGSLESDVAALRLARSLGFREFDEIMVFLPVATANAAPN
jgi:GNAT superfamily N-acetyltransferase